MQAELRDSLENLFADSPVSRKATRVLAVDTARGGTVAVHILCGGLTTGRMLTCTVTEKGRAVPGARWFNLRDVPVEENTGLKMFTERTLEGNAPNPHVVRRAPFRAYDAMEPIPGRISATRAGMALRLQVGVPAGSKAGARAWKIVVEQGAECIELVLKVNVARAVIPAVGRHSFPVTNWFGYEQIAARHGLKMWTEPYWKMLRQYAELMAHGRQNVFWIPLSQVFTVKKSSVTLNRGRLQRIVRTFSAAGLYYIEGGHVASRTGGEWNAKTFDIALVKIQATSPEGNACLASICRQLMEEIEGNGWKARWIQHVADEPVAANAADYRILTGMVHKYMPGIPILDATMDTSLVGAANMWCPQVQEYQQHQKEFEAQRINGDKIWYYTCCAPGGPWLNRLLDQELLRPVLLGWAGGLYQLDGFLHWGFNHYSKDQDPFEKSTIPNWGGSANYLPAGDTHIAYPGRGRPWSSLRLEAHREGFEDYELLQQLRRRNPRTARKVLAMAIRRFDQYTKNVKQFRLARKALLAAVAG